MPDGEDDADRAEDPGADLSGVDEHEAHRIEGGSWHSQKSEPGSGDTEAFEEPEGPPENAKPPEDQEEDPRFDDQAPRRRADDTLDRSPGNPDSGQASTVRESLERWTRGELAMHARDIGLEVHPEDEREDLIERLLAEM